MHGNITTRDVHVGIQDVRAALGDVHSGCEDAAIFSRHNLAMRSRLFQTTQRRGISTHAIPGIVKLKTNRFGLSHERGTDS